MPNLQIKLYHRYACVGKRNIFFRACYYPVSGIPGGLEMYFPPIRVLLEKISAKESDISDLITRLLCLSSSEWDDWQNFTPYQLHKAT